LFFSIPKFGDETNRLSLQETNMHKNFITIVQVPVIALSEREGRSTCIDVDEPPSICLGDLARGD
jgi:hypothetical protein